jgi:hypothetical protein
MPFIREDLPAFPYDDEFDEPVLGSSGFQLQGSWPDNRDSVGRCDGPAVEPRPPEETASPTAELTIYWLCDQTYRVGGSEPIYVDEQDDCLLRAFIGHPVLNKPALVERSGIENSRVVTALNRLTKKYHGVFAAAIRRPGKRGQGGYRAIVVDARPATE